MGNLGADPARCVCVHTKSGVCVCVCVSEPSSARMWGRCRPRWARVRAWLRPEIGRCRPQRWAAQAVSGMRALRGRRRRTNRRKPDTGRPTGWTLLPQDRVLLQRIPSEDRFHVASGRTRRRLPSLLASGSGCVCADLCARRRGRRRGGATLSIRRRWRLHGLRPCSLQLRRAPSFTGEPSVQQRHTTGGRG